MIETASELEDRIAECLPDAVAAVLKRWPHSFISGGFMRDAAVEEPYKDIDLFGFVGNEALEAADFVVSEYGGEALLTKSLATASVIVPVTARNTDNTMLLWEPRTIQFIDNILPEQFDFRCCRGVYGLNGCNFIPWTCYENKEARLNRVDCNSRTLGRAVRLIKRGWEIPLADLAFAATHFKDDEEFNS